MAKPAPAAAPSHSKLTAAQREAAAEAAVKLLAPADEYFGPLKQSVVGMRNEIRVLGWNYDVNHDIWHQTFESAMLTERAVRDWVSKYPHDGQIPRTIFLLQRLYTKVLSQESRDHAHAIAQWLLLSYSKSPQARQLKKTLALEHLAPLPSPTPSAPPIELPVDTTSAAPAIVPPSYSPPLVPGQTAPSAASGPSASAGTPTPIASASPAAPSPSASASPGSPVPSASPSGIPPRQR